jgi:predicted Zn-ribbon and HTH transcriptional regulator
MHTKRICTISSWWCSLLSNYALKVAKELAMKINTENMDKAFKVLDWIKKLAKSNKNKETFCLLAYANCREQGFAIRNLFNLGNSARWARFSECRNSDSICVWTGKGKFYLDQIQDTDEAIFFKWNEYRKAAKFIIKFLEQ